MILIDLQKAFYTIDHKILLRRLKYIGLSDTATSWIKSYLRIRVTFVEIEGYKSSERYIKCRVHFSIIYKLQSCFRSDFSTDTCFSYLHNKILKAFNESEYTGMILIDLLKAFDTIDHKILLRKLKYIGLSDTATSWIKSYLRNCVTFVEIDGYKYSKRYIKCRVHFSIIYKLQSCFRSDFSTNKAYLICIIKY